MINLRRIITFGISLEQMNSRPAAVIIILVLNLVFLGLVIYAYRANLPIEIKTTLTTCFAGWNGALALALNSKSTPFPPSPPTSLLPTDKSVEIETTKTEVTKESTK